MGCGCGCGCGVVVDSIVAAPLLLELWLVSLLKLVAAVAAIVGSIWPLVPAVSASSSSSSGTIGDRKCVAIVVSLLVIDSFPSDDR